MKLGSFLLPQSVEASTLKLMRIDKLDIQQMGILFLSFAVFTLPIFAFAALGDNWEKISEEEGILAFKQEIPDSPVIAVKGVGRVDAPIAKVASVLVDDHRIQEWVDTVRETRIVKMLSANEALVYTHVGTPFFLMDRDFLMKTRFEVDAKAQSILLSYAPIVDPAVPVGSYVRGEIISSSFSLKSANNGAATDVVAIVQTDPKGAIPKFLVNLFQKSWPVKTLRNLRRQSAKRDIVESAEIKAALFPLVKLK